MQAWLRPTGAARRPRRMACDRGRRTGVRQAASGWSLLALTTLNLTLVAAGDGVLPGDVAVTRAVQGLSLPGLDALAGVVNSVGGTLGMCLIAATAVWHSLRRGNRAAALVVLGALALRFGNALIKTSVESPRPAPHHVDVTEGATGYGFPSAHVMGVVLLFGIFFVLAPDLVDGRGRRLALRIAAGAMLLTIGFGRVYAGAHWPSDVLGAYLYGILGLAGLLALYRAGRAGYFVPLVVLWERALGRLVTARTTSAAVWAKVSTSLVLGRGPTAQPVPIRVRDRERSRGE